jgi:hypothetical protein
MELQDTNVRLPCVSMFSIVLWCSNVLGVEFEFGSKAFSLVVLRTWRMVGVHFSDWCSIGILMSPFSFQRNRENTFPMKLPPKKTAIF